MFAHSRVVVLCLTVVCWAPGGASAEVYKWVDASGRTHYSDVPPTDGSKAQVVGVPATVRPKAPAGSAGGDEAATPAGGRDARPASGKEPTAKDSKGSGLKPGSTLGVEDAAAARSRKENCTRGQAELQALNSDNRLFTVDAQGERQYLDDQQRSARIAELQQLLPGECAQ